MRAANAEDLLCVAEELGSGLVARRENLAVAESCTGGLIAATLTEIPGASRFFWGGVIVYSAAAKTQLAGLAPAFLAEHGTVSAATTEALAEAVRRCSGANYGLAVTGWAGPGAGEGAEVGSVFGALATSDGVAARHWAAEGCRDAVRAAAAYGTLSLLRERLRDAREGCHG